MPKEEQLWQEMYEELTNANDPLTTEAIDQTIEEYNETRLALDELDKEVKRLTKERVELEQKIIAMCETTGKKNWEVPGMGKAIIINKKNFKLPKDPFIKQQVFDWIALEHGDEGLASFQTINHQSFNKLMREKVEEEPEFKLEGIEEPYEYKTLQWRKS